MRKHHKYDSLVWGSCFRKSSVRGSNPKEKEDTISIDVKGGEID
jgi:hypothetical protein